jgi:hypothetical protein
LLLLLLLSMLLLMLLKQKPVRVYKSNMVTFEGLKLVT